MTRGRNRLLCVHTIVPEEMSAARRVYLKLFFLEKPEKSFRPLKGSVLYIFRYRMVAEIEESHADKRIAQLRQELAFVSGD